MRKLTGLQIANFHRQLERRDVIRSHDPLCAAAASVLHAERRDRRPAVGSRDPGDVHRAFGRHGDGGAVGGLGYWWAETNKESILSRANVCERDLKTNTELATVVTASQLMEERKKFTEKEKKKKTIHITVERHAVE